MTKPHTTLDVILDIFITLTSTREKNFRGPGSVLAACVALDPRWGRVSCGRDCSTPGGQEEERERQGKGQGPLASFKEMPNVFVFPTRPQFPQTFSNVSSSFESSKGINSWLGHCPHGLIISGNALADRTRGLWHLSLRLLSIQSKFSERDIYVYASPADISQGLLFPPPHRPFWRQDFSLTWDSTRGWASWLCT